MMFVSGVENEDLYHADTLVKLADALLRLAGTVSAPGHMVSFNTRLRQQHQDPAPR